MFEVAGKEVFGCQISDLIQSISIWTQSIYHSESEQFSSCLADTVGVLSLLSLLSNVDILSVPSFCPLGLSRRSINCVYNMGVRRPFKRSRKLASSTKTPKTVSPSTSLSLRSQPFKLAPPCHYCPKPSILEFW